MGFYGPVWLMIGAVVSSMALLLIGGPLLSKFLHNREKRRQDKHNHR